METLPTKADPAVIQQLSDKKLLKEIRQRYSYGMEKKECQQKAISNAK